MPARPLVRLAAVLALALALGPAAACATERVPVLASFSILADLVGQVGGDRVAVSTLVGPDADMHGFQPAPADAAKVAAARLVVVNGLGFEGFLDRLVRSAGAADRIAVASRGVKPLKAGGHGHAGHAHGPGDPHAWGDVANAKLYVANIRDALAAADPAGADVYRANAARFLEELDALDAETRRLLGAVPAANRAAVTSHDSFAYLAAAYGLRLTPLRTASSEGELSARDLARIVREVKAAKAPVVFLENVSDPRLAQRIAAETGARIGGRLHSDALSGPDGPAPTYVALMRANARTLAAALAP